MSLLYLLISIIVTIVWFFYFRKINLFSKPNLKLMIIAFSFGLVSVTIVKFLNSFNDFLIFKVFIEEFVKISFFIFFYIIFKKDFKEPFDYVVYISMVALGFTVLENFVKFNEYFVPISENSFFFDTYILARIVFGPLGHLTYGVIAVYGWIRFKYAEPKNNYLTLFKYLLIAFISHCFYNYIVSIPVQESLSFRLDFSFFNSKLLADDSKEFHIQWALVLVSFYTLFLSSIFVTIINNVLNNAINFNYKKIITQDSILKKLLIGYGLLFILQLVLYLIIHSDDLDNSNRLVASNSQLDFIKTSFKVFLFAITTLVVLMRITRFNLLKGTWQTMKIELPFYIFKDNYLFKIKGDSNEELKICSYHNQFFNLFPVNNRKSLLRYRNKAFLDEKIVDYKHNTYFLVKLYTTKSSEEFDYFLLTSKSTGMRSTIESYPIVNVYQLKGLDQLTNIESNINQLKLFDIAYVKS